MILRTALPLIVATLLSACATSTPLPTEPNRVVAGSWTLQQASRLTDIPVNVRVVFHSAPPRGDEEVLAVSGFAGVNHFRGDARANPEEKRLVMGLLASTRLRSDQPRMQFERAFLAEMEQVVGFEWQGQDTLVLQTLPGETLTFVQASR